MTDLSVAGSTPQSVVEAAPKAAIKTAKPTVAAKA